MNLLVQYSPSIQMSETSHIKLDNYDKEEGNSNAGMPISNFLFALKSAESKRQYPRRLKMFFKFEFDKSLSLEAQANLFLKQASRGKNGIQRATQYFIQFLNYQKDRVQKNDSTFLILKTCLKSKIILK